ncbi:(2Fe-2S) ferredoxin domain-containing protein [Candidatus Woesearchaeota archaeon]|nr:(2Fe-2S) ferredoxin domain-containing protein [Candidatus Woesearchaeota archaeon]
MKELPVPTASLHVFICMNDREEDNPPSCGRRFTLTQFKQLKQWVREHHPDVRITRTFCLGHCTDKGIVVLLQPMQKYFIVDNLEEVKTLITHG